MGHPAMPESLVSAGIRSPTTHDMRQRPSATVLRPNKDGRPGHHALRRRRESCALLRSELCSNRALEPPWRFVEPLPCKGSSRFDGSLVVSRSGVRFSSRAPTDHPRFPVFAVGLGSPPHGVIGSNRTRIRVSVTVMMQPC